MGMDKVMISGKLDGVMVNTLGRNAKSVGSNPALGATSPLVLQLPGTLVP